MKIMKNERTENLRELDRKYLWHPFTPMLDWIESEPLIIEYGEGAYIYDTDGRRYLDGVSSLWVNTHGHRAAKIDAAIRGQLDRIAHSTLLGLGNVPSIELAARLVSLAPAGLSRVFYSDSGSTAVEIALKIAFQRQRQRGEPHPSKVKFVTFVNAYHGDTIGSVSVGGIDLFHAMYKPLLFHSHKAPSPHCYRCHLGLKHPSCGIACLDALEDILKERSGEIAGVIIEPLVQGAAGMITAPAGHLRRVRELCNTYDVLMIADEVAVGFGRTGRMFACEHEGVTPDIMTLAKGITGGYIPLAATLVTDEVFSAFLSRYEEGKTFYHGHTYTGNPLACAAAMANLDIFKEDNVIENLAPKIARMTGRLKEITGMDHVGDARQRGMMAGIELVSDKLSKEPYNINQKVGVRVCMKTRERGVILRPLGDVVVLMPPLCVTAGQIDELMEAVRLSIAEVCGS